MRRNSDIEDDPGKLHLPALVDAPGDELLPVLVGDGEVTTVEGLATGESLHPLQIAFAEEGAAQCGYCTPGMLMTAKALLGTTARPTRDEIAHAISGNLCRCTGYTAIYEAIEKAARA